MTVEDLLMRDIRQLSERAAEIRRKALILREYEVARRLLVASRLIRAASHSVGVGPRMTGTP